MTDSRLVAATIIGSTTLAPEGLDRGFGTA